MDEVEAPAVTEPSEVRSDCLRWHGFLKGDESLQPENRVVEVAVAGAVLKPAVGIQATVQERGDEIPGLTELLRRQPRDLQHFEPQTHCTIPGSRSGRSCQRRGATGLSDWRSAGRAVSESPAPCTSQPACGSARRRPTRKSDCGTPLHRWPRFPSA